MGIVWRLLSVRLWGAGFLRDRRACGLWDSDCELAIYVVLGMWANESTISRILYAARVGGATNIHLDQPLPVGSSSYLQA